VINPNQLSANVATTSWELYTATSSSYYIDGAYENLRPQPDLQGVAVSLSMVELDSLIVNKESNLNIGFLPNSDLPADATIEIILPPEFARVPSKKRCSQISPSAVSLSCEYVETDGYVSSIIVNNP
jgi:hypothetical protein